MSASEAPRELTLFTIAPSHYCLRASWALERAGLRPTVVRLTPLLHVGRMAASFFWAGVAPRAADVTSSPFGTPQLLVRGGGGGAPVQLLPTGSAVVAWADGGDAHRVFPARAPLPPEDAAAEAELRAEMHDRLGVAVRAWVYSHAAHNLSYFNAVFAEPANAGGALSGALVALLSPALMLSLRAIMGVGARDAARARAEGRIRAVFDAASRRLDDGAGGTRPFLFGDAFGPADLDLAALGAYACGGAVADAAFAGVAKLPDEARLPADMRAFAAEMAATRAGRHIAAMVRDHRVRGGKGV